MERNFCCLQKAPLHEDQLKLWLCEVLLALHYIHGRHVLHRDIKSSNIFLTAEADVQIGGDAACCQGSAFAVGHVAPSAQLQQLGWAGVTVLWPPSLEPYSHTWQQRCAHGCRFNQASHGGTATSPAAGDWMQSVLLQVTLVWQPLERMEAKRTRAWSAPPASCLQRYCPSSPTALPRMCGEQRIATAPSDCNAASHSGTVLAVHGAMGWAPAYSVWVHRNRVCHATSCTALNKITSAAGCRCTCHATWQAAPSRHSPLSGARRSCLACLDHLLLACRPLACTMLKMTALSVLIIQLPGGRLRASCMSLGHPKDPTLPQA